MEKHTLLVHVGTPKTGTSSLQRFLYMNRHELLKNSWDYPCIVEQIPCNYRFANEYPENNGFELYYAFIDSTPMGDVIFDKVMNYVVERLQYTNVVISCECFWIIDIQSFFERVLHYWKNIKIVAYIRRQDEYIESLWEECVKLDVVRETATLEDYIEKSESNGMANYLSNLIPLEKMFRENLIVKLYDCKRDVILDFLEVLNINSNMGKWENVQRSNIGWDNITLEIKRVYNIVAKKENFPFKYDAEFVSAIKTVTSMEKKHMSKCLRIKILKRHEKENIEIADKFFNKRNTIFPLDDREERKSEYHTVTSFEYSIIMCLIRMWYEFKKKL